MEAARIQRSIKLGPAPSPWHNPTEVLPAEALGVNHITICKDIIHFLLPNSSFLEWGGEWVSPMLGFPGSSAAKKSACNAGDPGLIPGQEDPLEKG